MVRGRVELKRIENRIKRQVTFSKRRNGLLKKAHELAVLCDAQVGVIIFSSAGKLFEYSNPPGRMGDLIHRYDQFTTNRQLQETSSNDQQMIAEITRLQRENEALAASLRRYTGQDLSSLASVDELNVLEQRLESAVRKVRERKDELMIQMIDDVRRKINESEREAAAAGGVEDDGAPPPPTVSECLRPAEEASTPSTALQMWPRLDDAAGFGHYSSPRDTTCITRASPGHGLQLW
ncbi:hypothetical protein ACP70R_043492 [Stipagrostis hirtigluma subsp. patula]